MCGVQSAAALNTAASACESARRCDTTFCALHLHPVPYPAVAFGGCRSRCGMLRTFFVRLSENASLRRFAERSSLGHRISGRFVAGTEVADAVRATQAVNR